MTAPDQELARAVARLNARAWGIAIGLLSGLGLFIATIVLVIKGGPNPGPHLILLRIYFPGYRISVLGAVVGFVYAFVVGYALGRLIGTVYNKLVAPGRQA
jgi:ABC-type uncharacterized transport system fused permease/ATPase subunit